MGEARVKLHAGTSPRVQGVFMSSMTTSGSTSPYRILSIDGGGVRGAFAARLIEKLDAAAPFLAGIDLFAGTSTGSIIALCLANGMPIDEIRKLYVACATTVFSTSWLRRAWSVWGFRRAIHDNGNLEKLLTTTFQHKTLGDLDKKVLIPTFDLDNDNSGRKPHQRRTWKPKFFHNFGNDEDRKERIVDVILRSTAAPMYFPSFQGYIDGGVAANNPSMAALAQALDPPTGGQRHSTIRLLSIGTGLTEQYIPGDTHRGALRWGKPLVQIMIDGNVGVADYQCERILGDKYHRVDGNLDIVDGNRDKNVELDDSQAVPALMAWAEKVNLAPSIAWVETHFRQPPTQPATSSSPVSPRRSAASDPPAIDAGDIGA
jgi:uncharacterized protein